MNHVSKTTTLFTSLGLVSLGYIAYKKRMQSNASMRGKLHRLADRTGDFLDKANHTMTDASDRMEKAAKQLRSTRKRYLHRMQHVAEVGSKLLA